MKKIILMIFLIIGFIIIGWNFIDNKVNKQKEIEKIIVNTPNIKPSITLDISQNEKKIEEKKSIFIPYWQINQHQSTQLMNNLKEKLTDYQRLIYFGDEKNINGFINLTSQLPHNPSYWLTEKVTQVPQKSNWQLIIDKNINLLTKNNFEGVVLDLEISGLKFDSLVSQINDFVQFFTEKIKEKNFKVALAVYGDIFYRQRPYDLSFLAKNVDEIMIMAYDFSKSYGQPGPNFPFEGKNFFGYDFKTMIDDFLMLVPKEKLTVIFGLYGYDWRVDEKKRPISQAKALTLKEIKKIYLVSDDGQNTHKCQLKNCLIKRDQAAKEVEINYIISSSKPDEEGIYRLDYHIIWFEDEESVKIKRQFLKEKGISRIVYWAYGYF